MSGSLFPNTNGYVDPATGMWVPAAATPSELQARQSNPMGSIIGALAPALHQNQNAQPQPDPYASAQMFQQPPPAQAQPVGNQGLVQNPDGSVGTPGGGFKPPPQAPQQPQPAPQPAPQQPPQQPQAVPQPQPDQGQNDPTGLSIKRNNPLNLRFAGQDGASNNGGFAQFPTVQDGYNAASSQMGRYADRGINTLRGLISTWAPPSENDTNSYIATVSKATGLDPDAQINLRDPATVAKIMPAMARVESGPGGDAPGVTIAATTTQPADTGGHTPDQAQQLNALGIDPAAFKMPFDWQKITQPSMTEKLAAIAQGLSKGDWSALAGLGTKNREMMLQANTQAMGNERLLGMLGYQNGRLGIQQQTANNGTDRVGIAQQQANTSSGRLQVAQQALQNRFDPTMAGAVAQGRKAGTDAATDINNTLSTQSIQADTQALSDIGNTERLVQQNPGLVGPTLANRWARFAATNGLTGDAADLNALQKMTTDQRNSMLAGLTNGHVGGIRSNAELQNISKAVADPSTAPQALQFINNLQRAQIQARQSWRQELTTRLQTNPQTVTGQNLPVTRDQFFDNYYKANPLPDYTSVSGAPAARPGTNPDGTTKGATGKPSLRYDQTTGQMVPM